MEDKVKEADEFDEEDPEVPTDLFGMWGESVVLSEEDPAEETVAEPMMTESVSEAEPPIAESQPVEAAAPTETIMPESEVSATAEVPSASENNTQILERLKAMRSELDEIIARLEAD